MRLRPPEPEEADNDGEVDDLLRVALDVEDERVRDRRRGRDDHDDGRDQVDDQPGQRGLARRPVRRPEAVPEGQRDALLGELLVDAGCSEGDSDHVPQGTQRDEDGERFLCLGAEDVVEEEDEDNEVANPAGNLSDFDYLLGMAIWSLTKEKASLFRLPPPL